MEMYGYIRVAGGASDASQRAKIMGFCDALDLHVELVVYCNHAHDGTLPAHVLILPANHVVTECTSKLWEGFAVVLYGTWEDAVARCYEAHDADADSDASNRDASIMKRRKVVGLVLEETGGTGAVLPGFDTLRVHKRRLIARIRSITTAQIRTHALTEGLPRLRILPLDKRAASQHTDYYHVSVPSMPERGQCVCVKDAKGRDALGEITLDCCPK